MRWFFLFVFLVFLSALSSAQKYISGELLITTAKNWQVVDILKDYNDFELTIDKQVGNHLNCWLLNFDEKQHSFEEISSLLLADTRIGFVQRNHILQLRQTFPNDNVPWPLHNDGTTGGTADADIDAPEAWDLTTGGLTANGDTIVIAVVDGDFLINDPQLNFWINKNEIPGNGIDDDNNGYIDDVNGWNTADNNGNVSTGSANSHGQAVAKDIAEIGNNMAGGVGVCWNTKILPVEIFGTTGLTEANAVAGFNYLIQLKKDYIASAGSKGAYIVANNNSFGFDNAFPVDHPIWCATYDSLGKVGILSIGATSNSNVNIDVVGDIPSTCPSEHLIVVTATNANDNLANAGFGTTHVDLGAPSSTTATSFSAPLVAGTIGLLHANGNVAFNNFYNNDFEQSHACLRSFILNGVDVVGDLGGQVGTNGRLNAFNSLQIQNSNGSCVVGITDDEINSIGIYPNPGKNKFTINSSLKFENFTVVVNDLSGKIITTIEGNNNRFQLNVPAGLYILQLNSKSNITTFTQKLIVE